MRLLATAAMCLVLAAGTSLAKPAQTSYDVQAVEVPGVTALVVNGKEDPKKVSVAIKAALDKVQAYMKSKKITATGVPLTKTVFYKQGFLEFQSGFPIAKGQKSDGEFLVIEIPGGKVAKTVHTGPADQSSKAYSALQDWMTANKKKSAGNPWEVYAANDKMEVFYPIKDKK